LVDALVAAVRAGALEHKEKGRVAAFAPVFAELFTRRPVAAYATNWFAAELSRLLHADSFGLLKGDGTLRANHSRPGTGSATRSRLRRRLSPSLSYTACPAVLRCEYDV